MKDATAARKSTRAASRRPNGGAASQPKLISAHLRESIDPDRRRAMVAEAAYFYAEHRGFEPGHELDDWLAAENQIDSALTLPDIEAAVRLREQTR